MTQSLFTDPSALQRFLRDDWQRKPVLMRAAIDPGRLAFAADELAGLACEEGVESRLIEQRASDQWSLRHGPFAERDFTRLPETHWTLLVQDVDKYVPQVHSLLDLFGFLPDWRIDDIMISYATDQGGVGPHTDNYDVFLVQAQGKRRWRISERRYTDSDLLRDCPLRVLDRFATDQEWLLEPGDLLYLPPRVAHWGIAEGECMTWSIGMRGPSAHELAAAWLAHTSGRSEGGHFADNLARKPSASRIDAHEFADALQLIQSSQPVDDASFREWFACHVTEAKAEFEIPPVDDPLTGAQLAQELRRGAVLHRHPWARFATVQLDAGHLALCSQGECHPITGDGAALLELIGSERHLDWGRLQGHIHDPRLLDWLSGLYNCGLLTFDD